MLDARARDDEPDSDDFHDRKQSRLVIKSADSRRGHDRGQREQPAECDIHPEQRRRLLLTKGVPLDCRLKQSKTAEHVQHAGECRHHGDQPIIRGVQKPAQDHDRENTNDEADPSRTDIYDSGAYRPALQVLHCIAIARVQSISLRP